MTLLSVAWPMLAATGFTLAGVHLIVWVHARRSWGNLLFAVAAVSAGAVALLELAVMRATTTAAFGELVRWLHVPVATLTIAIVGFIRYHLGVGRTWLAWTIIALRVAVLVVNFTYDPNATYREITALGQVPFLGETVAVAAGASNPFRGLTHASAILLIWYVVDATVTGRKRDNRRSILAVGLTVCGTTILSLVFSLLMTRGLLPGPLIGFNFLLIVFALSYELSWDIVRANEQAAVLKENQKRMNLAARAADLQIWEWDIERDRVWAPRQSGTPSGETDDDITNLAQSLETVHEEDRETVRRAVAEAVGGKGEIALVYRVLGPGGTYRWVDTNGQVERDATGRPKFMRGVSRDITEQKQLQDEFAQQQEALLHLQRVASLEQLSSTLAHELGQPLGAILRNAEAAELFLRKQPPELDEIRAILADIQLDDKRATETIKRMRSMLRRRAVEFRDVGIVEVVGEVAAITRAEFQKRRVALRTEAAPGLPNVHGDRVQLQQVLLNLLLNGLDAMEGRSCGSPEIVVRVSAQEDGAVEVAVTDCGAGIPADRVPHIFEPFVTSKPGSMGVGLSLCRNIIEAHGGRIWAENNADGGSTFRFTLPPRSEQGAG